MRQACGLCERKRIANRGNYWQCLLSAINFLCSIMIQTKTVDTFVLMFSILRVHVMGFELNFHFELQAFSYILVRLCAFIFEKKRLILPLIVFFPPPPSHAKYVFLKSYRTVLDNTSHMWLSKMLIPNQMHCTLPSMRDNIIQPHVTLPFIYDGMHFKQNLRYRT